MDGHFTESDWVGYLKGDGDLTCAQEIRNHLDLGCPSCGQQYSFWLTCMSTMKADQDPIPRVCRHRSRGFVRPEPAPPRRAAVRLVFDSFILPQQLNVRGVNPRRHCLYALGEGNRDEFSVEVMAERISSHEQWCIVGQVLNTDGKGWERCRIELARDGDPGLSDTTNGFGEFAFVRVGPGPWHLRIWTGSRAWEVSPVMMPAC